jgi:hypothetical protein
VTPDNAVLPAGARKISAVASHLARAYPHGQPGRITTIVYNGQVDPATGQTAIV